MKKRRYEVSEAGLDVTQRKGESGPARLQLVLIIFRVLLESSRQQRWLA